MTSKVDSLGRLDVWLACLALAVGGGAWAAETPASYDVSIGPVAGLTSDWHPVPQSTSMLLGAVVQFKVDASALPSADLDGSGMVNNADLATLVSGLGGPGFSASAGDVDGDGDTDLRDFAFVQAQFGSNGVVTNVTWTGATEIERTATYSLAEASFGSLGIHAVSVTVTATGAPDWVLTCPFEVVDVQAENVGCAVTVSVPPLLVDENSTNAETIYYFSSSNPLVSRLRQDGPNQYHTSVKQWITFTAQTQPAGFEPLMEWRSGGQVLTLGQTLADHIIVSPGNYIFDVGPTAQPEQIQIDTYSVTITSHVSNVDSITEGVPTTFTAVTNPPGYEADITWVSSTLYGTAAPVVGSGPSFTAQFDDTIGADLFQWFGVRGDNAKFFQDIPGACCIPASDGPCGKTPASCVITATAAACTALDPSAIFLGPGTVCEQTVVVNNYDNPNKANHRIVTVQNCPGVSRAGETCVDCADKIDSWVSASDESGGSQIVFSAFPIPADFFGPGSEPFVGTVSVRGVPIGDIDIPGCPPGSLNFGEADTLVRRSGGPFGDGDPFDRCDFPPFPTAPVTVDIELVALSLVSCDPVSIMVGGVSEDWIMEVGLSDNVPQPPGTLTATKEHCNGGTFDSMLDVCPKFTFTKVDPPNTVLELDDLCVEFPDETLTMEATGIDWIHDPAPNVDLPNPVCTTFHPGLKEVSTTTDCDCNGNSIRDKCDIENGTSLDCNTNGIPDECEIDENSPAPGGPFFCTADCDPDCNTNGIPDECDIAAGTSLDCNANGIPDECDIADGASQDCNSNDVPDECDIAVGTSEDCQPNGIPDECELPPSAGCTTALCLSGCSADCNENCIPDECELDCNNNGIPDDCDIAAGTSQDCNANGIPDECDIAGVITEIIDAAGDGTGNGLDSPLGIAVDAAGNAYVTGRVSDNAFKITPAGFITEIIDAGNGLDFPAGIAVDAAGNAYVTGRHSDNAFKITPAGVITEIIDSLGAGAGNFLTQPLGIAVDAAGNVYVAGEATDNAFKITPGGVITEIIDCTGDGTGDCIINGVGNSLLGTFGIAVDGAGNAYVTGQLTHNAFKITPGGVITEIIDAAGDSAGNILTHAVGIAVDGAGNAYVVGELSDNVFKITPAGVITQIIDAGGDGAGNFLTQPIGIAVDASGNAYVTGAMSDNAFKITPAGVITEIIDAGNGLDAPKGIAVDGAGNLFVTGGLSDNAFKITTADCNANGVPDDCDIVSGTSLDLNNNGIPDECEP